MPVPLIGVTIFRTRNRKGYPIFALMEAYVQAVAQAGAAPLLIPLGLNEEVLKHMVTRLDGVLFTGGGDVHPSFYNHASHKLIDEIDVDRDRTEIQLIQDITKAGKPFLGICRGIQVINVALGGSLYVDILAQREGALDHSSPDERSRDFLVHSVQIGEESRLREILGVTEPQVNSLHHQAIRDLAPGVKTSALAPDGIVEAIELPDYPFGLAVQWHPEWLQAHEPMRNLFRSFVDAARNRG